MALVVVLPVYVPLDVTLSRVALGVALAVFMIGVGLYFAVRPAAYRLVWPQVKAA
jgi:hypothetical protein